jgi:hypothetical protein
LHNVLCTCDAVDAVVAKMLMLLGSRPSNIDPDSQASM